MLKLEILSLSSCHFSFLSMAAESYESGYLKHYGPRFENVSYDSTEEVIKDVYANWASQYDKVRKL